MTNKLSLWLSERRPSIPSFRFIFTLMYMGVIGSIAYFNVLMNCGRRFLGGGAAALAVMFVLLIGLERFEQGRYRYEAPAAVVVLLLLARMALFEGVAALDCSTLSVLLYPIIPFGAYFTFGAGTSGALSAFYMLFVLWKGWQLDPNWYVNPMITVILVAFVLILAFMGAMAQVIRSDEQGRRRTEQLLADLEASHVKLQAYAEQVADLAATAERNRLARDIHDSVGHYLTAVSIQLEKALAYRERSPEEATQAIRDAKQAASQALRDVRRSVGALRSFDNGFSLTRAMADLVKGMDDGRLTIDLTISGDEKPYERPTLMALHRATQEGLTNIQKHAGAAHVTVDLRFGAEVVVLRLQDDGQGFDTSTLDDLASMRDRRFGLRGIQERLKLVGGQVEIRSRPRQGAELTISAPKHLATRQPEEIMISSAIGAGGA